MIDFHNCYDDYGNLKDDALSVAYNMGKKAGVKRGKAEVIDEINKNIDSWWGNCSKGENDQNWYASLKMLLKELEEQK